jgi:hypothetical protein
MQSQKAKLVIEYKGEKKEYVMKCIPVKSARFFIEKGYHNDGLGTDMQYSISQVGSEFHFYQNYGLNNLIYIGKSTTNKYIDNLTEVSYTLEVI